MDITNIPRYDYDKRHWKKIYGIEEANKLGELLTGIPAGEIVQKQNQKPTVRVRIQRTDSLKGASVQKDDRAEKVLRLLTGNI